MRAVATMKRLTALERSPELPFRQLGVVAISSSRIRAPIGFVADRADYVAEYFAGTYARAKTAWGAMRGRRKDFSDGLPETGNRNGLASLENLLKNGQAGGFEFGNGYVVHEIHLELD
jgi:hypothetical protein